MTIDQAVSYACRIEELGLRPECYPPGTRVPFNMRQLAAALLPLTTEKADLMMEILERLGVWRVTGFDRMLTEAPDAVLLECTYRAAEIWDRKTGKWARLTDSTVEAFAPSEPQRKRAVSRDVEFSAGVAEAASARTMPRVGRK